MTERLYHMFMKDGDGWQQIPGRYNDDDKKVMLRAGWEKGLSPKFVLVGDSECVDSEAGTEQDAPAFSDSTVSD